MNVKKKLLAVAMLVLLLTAVAAGLIWSYTHYVIVEFQFYPRDAAVLDLRTQEIDTGLYDKLSAKLPDCQIRWDVPLLGRRYSEDTTALTVSELTQEDVDNLKYLPGLVRIDAEGCEEDALLLAVHNTYPHIELNCQFQIGDQRWPNTSEALRLTRISKEQLTWLPCLTQLKTVTLTGGVDVENFDLLQAYCREQNIDLRIELGQKTYADTALQLRVTGITDSELNLLPLMTNLHTLHLVNPQAEPESILALPLAYPELDISWEKGIFGQRITSDDRDLDLSHAGITSLRSLEDVLTYFPNVESVFLGLSPLDNEVLAQYRERVRQDYKVVWTVQCGEKLTCRTDATSFMPVRERVYYFHDNEAYNLRYCEEMEALDIGHMSIHDVSFLAFMPNLKYLILAHTEVQNIEPIRSCKNLLFLELDWSTVRDFSPLADCTSLEDLNVGNTFASIEPLKQLTWLKHLWMIGRSGNAAYEMTQALPTTQVTYAGDATVASGWRNLPNYFAMRDALGMEYMTW